MKRNAMNRRKFLQLTAGVVAYLQRTDPALLQRTAPGRELLVESPRTTKKLWLALAALLILTPFGTLAVELIAGGKTGRMVCIQNGVYAETDLPDPSRPPRVVNVSSDYDAARFRPRFANRFGRPIFL